MEPLFDPLNLDNRVSLNRTVLAYLPSIEASVRGRMAWESIASVSMRKGIALELPALATSDEDSIVALDSAVATGDLEALVLAKRFGTHLGYLLVTLMRDPGDEPFPRSYRAHWASLRHVYLGGGIVRGALGRVMRDEARRVLDDAGLSDVTLEVAAHPAALTSLGASRSAPQDTSPALVCDFGGTYLKRGVATYGEPALKTLCLLSEMPSLQVPERPENEDAAAAELGAYMTSAICEGLVEAPEATTVSAGIARYTCDGHPIEYGSGGYGLLRRLSDNASVWLSREVSQRVGREISVTGASGIDPQF